MLTPLELTQSAYGYCASVSAVISATDCIRRPVISSAAGEGNPSPQLNVRFYSVCRNSYAP